MTFAIQGTQSLWHLSIVPKTLPLHWMQQRDWWCLPVVWMVMVWLGRIGRQLQWLILIFIYRKQSLLNFRTDIKGRCERVHKGKLALLFSSLLPLLETVENFIKEETFPLSVNNWEANHNKQHSLIEKCLKGRSVGFCGEVADILQTKSPSSRSSADYN